MTDPRTAEGRLYDAYAQVCSCLSRMKDLYYDPIGPAQSNKQLGEAIGFLAVVQRDLAHRINERQTERR